MVRFLFWSDECLLQTFVMDRGYDSRLYCLEQNDCRANVQGHLRAGLVDVESKGKVRRIHIPALVADEALAWAERAGMDGGPLLRNRWGRPISARGLAQQLKARAGEFGVDERLVHPHAFRHLFARRFLEAGGDVVFLADLLGHSSVETTRVNLRRTATEQSDEVNRLVTW